MLVEHFFPIAAIYGHAWPVFAPLFIRTRLFMLILRRFELRSRLMMAVTAVTIMALAFPAMAQEGGAVDDQPTTPAAAAKKIDEIVGRIAKRPDRVWIGAFELRELCGKGAEHLEMLTPALSKQLEHESEHVRLAAAQVLLVLDGGDAELLFTTLASLITDAEKNDTVAAAARLAAMRGQGEGKHTKALIAALEERASSTATKLSHDARVNIAEALVELKKDALSLDRLRQLSASSTPELRDRASLALARQGYDAEIQGRIASLAGQSGDLALNARLAQEIASDRRVIAELANGGGRSAPKRDLVPTVISAVVKSYVDTSMTFGLDELPIDAPNLVDAAARGMVGSLDDYSQYLTAKEYRKANEEMAGSYVGIGAHVQKADYDIAVRIAQPIYNGPAYEAGLRSGDMLWELELEGKRIALEGMETEEVRNMLVGPAGTPIKLWVKRPGTESLVEINLVRRPVEVNTCEGTMLPGRIGYLKLTRFGGNSQVDMYRSLEMLKLQGMKGIIIDLRGNGGGYLHVVTQIAALFLKGDPQVALIKGVYDRYAKPEIEYARGPTDRQGRAIPWPRHEQPMVVLIDGSSASGSELLSGTLKDHERATVVGEKSFGKGVGQATYPISKPTLDLQVMEDQDRMLKVTVFNYYVLPSMTSVERVAGVGGVVPHVEVHNPSPSTWEHYRAVDISKTDGLAAFVRKNWETHKEAWTKLADYDAGDPKAYPGITELAKELNTPLPLDRLRIELRREIRSVVSDIRRRPFIQSYEEDFVLQRGIVELASKIEGFGLTSIEQYKPFLAAHGVSLPEAGDNPPAPGK